jgi:small subunit ribosomal protein S1
MATKVINKSSAMAQLLASHKSKLVTLKKGESVKGKITKLLPNEIIVEVGAKTEALVLEKDKRIMRLILSLFKVGDFVDVNVLNPESDSGQPIVSLRKYLGNIAWKKLEELDKSKEQIDVTITDSTKAGYVTVTDFGVSGFLPQSHVSFSHQQDLGIGTTIKVSILELNRPDNKVIFSQKASVSEEEFKKTLEQLKIGKKLTVEINNVTPIGLFVSFLLPDTKEKRDGFIHISEISWDKVDDLPSLYNSGEKIEAVVNWFDAENRRINLSVKRLSKDPFEALIDALPVDKKVTGKVSKIDDGGVTLVLESQIDIGEQVEGFIKKEKVPPGTIYTVDQIVTAIVSDYDKRRHRIILVPVLLEKPIGYR